MNYKTIKKESMSEFYEKKSRFIGYACPVSTEAEALEFLNKIKTKHADATHNCYVYLVRENNVTRFSDNGEPSGTAGKPMLEMLQKEKIVDICVVVTRYFGGILLGTGGLARAYTKGAKEALLAGEICTMTACDTLEVAFPYNQKVQIESLIAEHKGEILEENFGADIEVKFFLPSENTKIFETALTQLTHGRVSCKVTGEEYRGI